MVCVVGIVAEGMVYVIGNRITSKIQYSKTLQPIEDEDDNKKIVVTKSF